MATPLPQHEARPAPSDGGARLALVPNVPRAVIVARQSRTKDESMSVSDQIVAATAWCEAQGFVVTAAYSEPDTSGRRPLERRKGLRQAVIDVEEGRADRVVCLYYDRFARSLATRTEVVTRVERAGGQVASVDFGVTSDETAVQWLQGTMMMAFQEFYARQIGEKLVTTKQRNIDRGVPPFPRVTPAYRRREDGTLELDPVGAPLVREAVAMRLAGTSYTKIARWLGENGIKMTSGGVEALFASKLLVGEIHFGKFTPNLYGIATPLLDRATFRRLNESKSKRGRYSKSERLLARLDVLVCASCGSRLTVDTARRGSARKEYSYYRCGSRDFCAAPAIVSADVADKTVLDAAIRYAAEIEARHGTKGRASDVDEVEAARVRLDDADQKLSAAIEALLLVAPTKQTRDVLGRLQAERDETAAQHERLLTLSAPNVRTVTSADVDLFTLDETRDLIRATVARAVVTRGRGSDRIATFPRGGVESVDE